MEICGNSWGDLWDDLGVVSDCEPGDGAGCACVPLLGGGNLMNRSLLLSPNSARLFGWILRKR